MYLGMASLCLDMTVVPFNVKVSHKLHKLWNPEFRNFAHEVIAVRDAKDFVRPAKWFGYRE